MAIKYLNSNKKIELCVDWEWGDWREEKQSDKRPDKRPKKLNCKQKWFPCFSNRRCCTCKKFLCIPCKDNDGWNNPFWTGTEQEAPLFWSINWIAALLHLVNTVATIALWAASDEPDQTFALSETYAPWVNITGQDGCPASNATRIFQISKDWCIERRTEYTSDLSLWWLVIAFHFLSFAFQTFAMLQWRYKCRGTTWVRNYIEEVDKHGTNILRMLEYSISATLMQISIALILGIWQRLVIAGVAALTVVTMLCGLVAEQLKYDRKDMAWAAHATGWFSMLSVWAILGRQFSYTVEMSDESPPNFVYAIVIVIAILYIGFGVIQLVQLCKSGTEPDVELNRGVELAYCVNSLTSKTILGWVIFANALGGMAES